MQHYKGVLLRESLTDTTPLSRLVITSTRNKEEPTATPEQGSVWTWHSIEVPPEQVDEVADALALALKPMYWYTNLWIPGDYLLIFPNRIFRRDTVDAPVWKDALAFGESIGIPRVQMEPLNKILLTA